MTDEYAAMIMEELDIYNLGYITVSCTDKAQFHIKGRIYKLNCDFYKQMEILELLLLDVERLPEVKPTEETKKPTKRWYKVLGNISSSSFIPCLKKTASPKKT